MILILGAVRRALAAGRITIANTHSLRWPTLCLGASLLSAFAFAARADFRDGNGLYAECISKTASDRLICVGYISAIADTMMHEGSILGWKACLDNNVTIAQVRDVVIRALADRPETRHYSAVSLVARALDEAFPCPK